MSGTQSSTDSHDRSSLPAGAAGDVVPRTRICGLLEDLTGYRPSPSMTYRLVRSGKIPGFRLVDGGAIYVRRRDVEAYADRQLAAGIGNRAGQAAEALARIKSHSIGRDSRSKGGESR